MRSFIARLLPTITGLPLALTLLAGCSGSSAPRCYPVRGRVEMNNAPLAEAQVVFHPLSDQTKDAPQPIGTTDAQGAFSLTMLKQGDGAPVGDYAITVELREQRMVGEELVRDGPQLLPPRYADPRSSGLRHTVTSGSNEVPPLVIMP